MGKGFIGGGDGDDDDYCLDEIVCYSLVTNHLFYCMQLPVDHTICNEVLSVLFFGD